MPARREETKNQRGQARISLTARINRRQLPSLFRMPRRLHFTRSHAILRLKRRLEQDSFPRIQMSLIVGLAGGGGASGSFDMPTVSDASPLSDAVGAVGDADELAIPLLVIVFAAGLALASRYVVYVAPMLVAELLVDGALSNALYRRIKATDSPHS